ncbi:MAG: SDR family NAD(P)-dependent oxidoreductase [Acidimicrobiales bacterium]|jgi:decaprenylphospho-beta-D-erythro-pentofuranosid-2-ulose 2-reductase
MIDATGMPQSAVVIGGGSDIARDTLKLLASRRLRSVLLAGRDQHHLEHVAAELSALGVTTTATTYLDVTRIDDLEKFADDAAARLGQIDLVLVAAGDLGTADLGELDAPRSAAMLGANFVGPAAATVALARVLRHQGAGRIVILSSVAAVRVRRANFVYGSAKAGLDGFGLGLADALAGSGVEVTVVRPGFVRTKMTAGLDPAPLAVDATAVAEAIVRGLETGAAVVWVPAALRAVFAVMRLLPRSLWRRIPG